MMDRVMYEHKEAEYGASLHDLY